MEAIRKSNVKRTGRQIIIDLPDDFKAEEVDMILWPSENKSNDKKEIDLEAWRAQLKADFSKFNVDLSNLKYTRDELYDRP
jgi:hypothetical protein